MAHDLVEGTFFLLLLLLFSSLGEADNSVPQQRQAGPPATSPYGVGVTMQDVHSTHTFLQAVSLFLLLEPQQAAKITLNRNGSSVHSFHGGSRVMLQGLFLLGMECPLSLCLPWRLQILGAALFPLDQCVAEDSVLTYKLWAQ